MENKDEEDDDDGDDSVEGVVPEECQIQAVAFFVKSSIYIYKYR